MSVFALFLCEREENESDFNALKRWLLNMHKSVDKTFTFKGMFHDINSTLERFSPSKYSDNMNLGDREMANFPKVMLLALRNR